MAHNSTGSLSWRRLSDDKAAVKINYFLHFPDAFSQHEMSMDDAEYSFYWRLFHLMFKTGGFLPYDADTIRSATKRRSLKQTKQLLGRLLLLDEFEIISYSDVPEQYRKFFMKKESYFARDDKILFNSRVFELVEYSIGIKETSASNGTKGGRRELRGQDCEIEEDFAGNKNLWVNPRGAHTDSDTELNNISAQISAEKTITVRGAEEDCGEFRGLRAAEPREEDAAVCGASDREREAKSGELYSIASFRNLWNEWAEHFGLEKFNRLTDRKRKMFEVRQRHFAKDGAYEEGFWVKLLSAVAESKGGFYVGNNDGFKHCGTPWRVTFDWLFKNDDNVEKFLNAVQ